MINILWDIADGCERFSALQDQVCAAVNKAVERTGGPQKAQVGLLIVGDEAIHEFNLEYRGVDRPTDVLSFPLMEPGEEPTQADIDPETGEVVLGDIVISLPAIERQAEEYGHSPAREAAFLAVHGTLHLLGYDHETDDERAEMRKLEEAVLEAIGLERAEPEN
jgi:probable rRNA maturation factor